LLPSFKLPIQKGAPRRVIRERGQMAIEAREETHGAVRPFRGAISSAGDLSDGVVTVMRRLLLKLSLRVR
jgi:hypothetical protein